MNALLQKFTEKKSEISMYEKLHAINCSYIAYLFLRELNYDLDRAKKLSALAYIHDIGKIYYSEIINKPGKLTSDEFENVKKHSELGASIAQRIEYFKDVNEIIVQHHENINGSGYPKGLKEEEILKEAQILSMVDVFEAICSKRSYKESQDIGVALKVMKDYAGIKFNEGILNSFIEFVTKNQTQIENIFLIK